MRKMLFFRNFFASKTAVVEFLDKYQVWWQEQSQSNYIAWAERKKMTQSDKMMSDEILVWVCCAEQDRASQMYSDHPHSKEVS